MPVIRDVFLLCSLLALSQGFRIIPSLAKGGVGDITESQAKRDHQKPPGGLLSGNLLGGLLGKHGPVGGLLGKHGPVGGLLGKHGAVGSLLGGGGALGSLLGENGAVGGLLGEDGVLGGLLGGDGGIGGLLGEDGVLGGLLGGDGGIGGLLGEDGVLGGLLGEDGVVSGLLDIDGVLGGLLGKEGLLDALLGKEGVVNTLLDVILDILLGKNGLLGRNGLVGGLLGGRSAGDLTGPKILNNTLPKISLRSLPGFGHQIDFNTQLLVETTSAPGDLLCAQLEADVAMLVQDRWAAPQSDMDCKTVDMTIHVRPEVPLLDQPLKQLLSDTLHEVGCKIVNTRINAVSTLLGSSASAPPLGALGDLPSFSIIGDDSIQLDLNLLGTDVQGSMGASTQVSPLPATLLLATGRPPRLSLSPRTLSALLEPIQGQGAFNLSITSTMAPNSNSLSTAALLPFIPQLASVLPRTLPLELRVRVANEPLVAVRGGRATATLKATIDVLSPSLQSSQRPLFSLDADIGLNIVPSVSSGKLQTSLALDSINLTRAPLRLDPPSASSLTGWLKQVLETGYIPAINDVLAVSIPLPNVLNTSLRNAEVDVTDANDSSDQTDLKRFCSGGPLSLLPE
ncbi:BPI fold-containing family B member 3-like [Phaenicophaeus curvirostris]|uniref:BPI fold-containing family B member 3-like n=1 Tax=Phaenicophaeus curvirostris TaxID=33595 RepID=UPI0037F10122